jgi:hypothetical protein
MRPEVAVSELRHTKPSEYAVRFLFGGAITLATGLVARRWGPAIAGVFLAFPAILPASLTLVKQHAGRADAADDARGSRLGALALIAFAIVVAALAQSLHPALVLALATAAWLVVASTAWFVRFGRAMGRGAGERAP